LKTAGLEKDAVPIIKLKGQSIGISQGIKDILQIYIEKNTTDPEIKKYSVLCSLKCIFIEEMKRKRVFFTNTPETFIGNTTPLQPNIQSTPNHLLCLTY
jgi:hypothetical protein